MNERTHFFIKIYLSHFILERVDVGRVLEVSWRRGQTATYWPQVLLTIAALLSHSGWAAQPWVTEGPKPSVYRWLLIRYLVPQRTPTPTWTDWLKPSVVPGCIFVWHPPASRGRTYLPPSLNSTTSTGQGDIPISLPDAPVSLFFRLFTQVHLLIDSSVGGQYVTTWRELLLLKILRETIS